MALSNYDASQVSVVFAGHIVTGFADGTFVAVEQNEDSFSLQVGTDGDACRSKTNNRSGRLTFTLGQWSQSNTVLAGFHNADVLSPAGDGVAPVLVKDNTGTSIFAAEKAWIVKPPTSEFAREAGSREWVIETDNLLSQPGGNTIL